MWLWILIGLNIIAKVHGFSNGVFQQPCHSMLPEHRRRDGVLHAPQNTKPPFELSCDKPENEGGPITVSLRSTQTATQFRGFMVEARDTSGRPVGKFILLDPSMTRLLFCNGLADSAVINSNNQKKSWLKVNWMAQGADVDVTFRATFVETFDTFWEPVDAKGCQTTTPTPSTQPSTTTSTELSTTISTELSTTISTVLSTTISTELSTTISTTKSNTAESSMTTQQVFVICNLLEGAGIVAIIVDSFLVVLKMALSNIFITALHNSPFSHCLNKWSQISCSLLCAALEISAVVLLCVAEPIKVTLVALVCVAIVINFIELVIVCLPIGPSHELKEICDHAAKVFSVIHQIFTIAVIFVGVSDNCRKNWLLKVMVAFTLFILLYAIWLFVSSTQRKAILGRSKLGSLQNSERGKQQGKVKLSGAEVIVTAVSVIFTFGNLCFSVAVAVGIFECQQE
ncbi:uncharacterized protein LOC142946475 isoform X2 [Anarhichas minor]|uniref:uncharacterized protein LOC142946475 isoform X2 n=1 Tax=Anarhichas minor TaxID=65739 RepID=UPI003F73B769